MRIFILFGILSIFSKFILAQNAAAIIQELKSINKKITDKPCNQPRAAAISNRAMNIFMADKMSYLSHNNDLSYFTNYVTLNSLEGKFTLTHNFQQASGIDDPIKKLFNVGLNTNIANSYAQSFLNNRYENELGITLNFKWLGKIKTRFSNCTQLPDTANQKQSMDALRAGIVQQLAFELRKNESDFISSIIAIDSTEIPEQKIATARNILLKNFNKTQQEIYAEKFAQLQANLLSGTNNYKLISSYYTSITAYIPVFTPSYLIATTFSTPLQHKKPFPLNFNLSHTRLWESYKLGRLFLIVGTSLQFNNSTLSFDLEKINISDYKILGGTDTLQLAAIKKQQVYIGTYTTFLTPLINCRLVYFPSNSHVGFSFLIEQNLGSFNILKARIGVPVVLINQKKTAAVNVEFYISIMDIGNKIVSTKNPYQKNMIGLHVGIPFSRLMF